MPIGQWFSFGGRIRRSTWWLGYVLPIFLINIAATFIDVSLGFVTLITDDAAPADGFSVSTHGIGPFTIIALLVAIIGGLAGQVKRWHDRDKSGWWVLITFIPIVGPIWSFIELGFLRGTPGPNRFGPDPLGGTGAPQWQAMQPDQGWQQGGTQQWHQQPAQPQWQPPPGQGWQPPPAQGWQPPPQGPAGGPPPWQQPPQGYPPPPPGYGQGPPPGHGQPPPGYGQPQQPPPGWHNPGSGGGSVPPVRRG